MIAPHPEKNPGERGRKRRVRIPTSSPSPRSWHRRRDGLDWERNGRLPAGCARHQAPPPPRPVRGRLAPATGRGGARSPGDWGIWAVTFLTRAGEIRKTKRGVPRRFWGPPFLPLRLMAYRVDVNFTSHHEFATHFSVSLVARTSRRVLRFPLPLFLQKYNILLVLVVVIYTRTRKTSRGGRKIK
jgi:hypothetical protein